MIEKDQNNHRINKLWETTTYLILKYFLHTKELNLQRETIIWVKTNGMENLDVTLTM